MKRILIILGVLFLVCGLFAGYVAYDDHRIGMSSYEIYSPKLPEAFQDYNILLITDFHNSYFYDKVAQKVKEAKPDVILLGGDIATLNNEYEKTSANAVRLIGQLKDTAPIYMVTGNHEAYNNFKGAIQESFKQAGAKIIDKKDIYLEKDGKSIRLFGMKDPGIPDGGLAQSKQIKEYLNGVKKEMKEEEFNILLTHRANLFPIVAPAGFDLVLSGHLHGGLIRIPFVGGLVSPDREWFPEFTSGIYFRDKTKMVVSRGTDYDTSRLRVLNGPEVVKVTLKK